MDVIQHFAVNNLIPIRAIHIFCATLWAFAVIGSYFFYVIPAMNAVARDPTNDEVVRRGHWVLEQFDHLMIVEHIAFVGVLCTGALLYSTGIASLSNGWFLVKMLIVIPLFIPAEIYGAWYTHVKTARMKRNKDSDPEAYAAFRSGNNKLLWAGTIPTLVLIPSVLFELLSNLVFRT